MTDASLRVSIDGSAAVAGGRQVVTTLDQIKAKSREAKAEMEKVGKSPFFSDSSTSKILAMQRAIDGFVGSQRTAAQQFAQSSQQMVNSLLGVDRAAKSATASAAVFGRELPKQERAATQAAAAWARLDQASAKAARTVAANFQSQTNAWATYGRGILDADAKAKSAAQSAAVLSREMSKQERATVQAAAAWGRIDAAAAKSAATQANAFQQTVNAWATYGRGIADTDKPLRSAAASAAVFERELPKQERSLLRAKAAAEAAAKGILGVGSAVSFVSGMAMRTVTSIQALFAAFAVREIVQANVEYERFAATLQTVSGSPAAFATNLEFLKTSANAAGVALQDIGTPFARFMIAGQNAGFQVDQLRNSFDLLVKASRNFGLTSADTQGVIRALEQSLSKGKFMAEEVRLQLGDRLPIAMAALQKATGMTGEALNKAFEKGTLFTSEYFVPFIQALYDMSGGAEAFARTSQTLGADLGRLQNAFFLFARQIGEAGLNEAVSNVAKALTALMSGPGGQSIAQVIGVSFAFLADKALALTAAFTALAAVPVVRFLASLAGFTIVGRAAQALALGLTVVGGALGLFVQQAGEAALAQERLNTQLADEKVQRLIGEGKYQEAAAGLGQMAGSLGHIAARLKEIGDQRSVLDKLIDWADRNFVSTPPIQGGIGGETAGMGDVSGDTGGPSIGIGSAAGTLREAQARLATYQAAAEASIVSAKDLAETIQGTAEIITTAETALAGYHDRLAQVDAAERQVEAWREQIDALEASRAEMQRMLGQAEQGSPAFLKLVDGILQANREITVLGAMLGTTAGQADVLRAAIENQSPAIQGWVGVLAQAIGTIGALRRAQVDLVREEAFNPNGGQSTGIGQVLQRAADLQQQARDRADTKQLDTKGRRIEAENKYFDALKKSAGQITDNTAREQTLRSIEEQRARAIQGINSNTKQRADTTANAYANERARLLDNINTLKIAGDEGERTYSKYADGSKRYTAAQQAELQALRNLDAAHSSLAKWAGQADSFINSVEKAATGSRLATLFKGLDVQKLGTAEIEKYQKALEEVRAKGLDVTNAQKDLDAAMAKSAGVTEALAQETENLRKARALELEELGRRVQDAQDQNDILRLEIDGSDKASKAIADLRAKRALERIELERKRDILPDTIALTQAQKEAETDLTGAALEQVDAIRKQIAAKNEYYDALGAAEVERPILERNRDLAREAQEAWQEPFREAARSIQAAFADAFEGIFSGGIKSFSDLGKTIWGIFVKLAAQIAALLVFRPVVGGILSSLGASESFQRSLGIVPSGTQGSGSGFSLPSLNIGGSNVTGWLGDAWRWANTPFVNIGGSVVPGAPNAAGYIGAGGTLGDEFGGMASGLQASNGVTGGWNITPMDIAGPIMSALPGLLSGNYVQAGLGAGGFIVGNLILPGVGGPIGGMLGNLLGGLFKKKPSNEGAEVSFRLDEDRTEFFRSTKHENRVAQVDAYTAGLQEGLDRAAARYGVTFNAQGVVGSTFGKKEGSRFFYDPGQGIDNRIWADFEAGDEASTRAAAEKVIVAAILDGFATAEQDEATTQAGRDVAIAMANSVAETFEQLDADMAFAKAFEDFVQIGQGTFDPIAASYRKAVEEGQTYADGIVAQGRAFRQQAEDLGLGAEELEGGLTRADVATRGYILSMFDQERGLAASTLEIIKQKAAIAELETSLQEFNITAEEATTITEGLTQQLKDTFLGGLQAQINDLNGLGFLNTLQDINAEFQANGASAWELGVGMDKVAELSDLRIQKLIQEVAAGDNAIVNLGLLRDAFIELGWSTAGVDNAISQLGGTLNNAVGQIMAANNNAITLAQAQATLSGMSYVPGSATELVYGAIGGSNATFNTLGQGISPVFFQTIDTLLGKARSGTLTQSDLSSFGQTNLANQFSYEGRWNPGELNAIAGALSGLLQGQSTNFPTVGGSGSTGGGGGSNDDSANEAIRGDIDALQRQETAQRDAARAAEQLADAFGNAAESLRQYRLGLLRGTSDLNPNSLADQFYEAQRQANDAWVRLQAGDPEAARDLIDATGSVLELGKRVLPAQQYTALFSQQMDRLAAAESVATDAQQVQIALAQTANTELARIGDEIERLRDQLSTSNGGTPGTPTNPGTPSNPSVPTGPSLPPPNYNFGYGGLGRIQGESAQAFMLRMFPKAAQSLMADGVITEQEGYAWAQSIHPSGLGLTNAAYFGAARSGGYSGPFTDGGHTAWLKSDASGALWRAFIDEIRLRTTKTVKGDGFFNSWGAPKDYAAGGLVTGGIPGRDSVPAMLMPGERVFSLPHSQIIERLAANQANDNSNLVHLFQEQWAEMHREMSAMRAHLMEINAGTKSGNATREEMRDEARSENARRAPKNGQSGLKRTASNR